MSIHEQVRAIRKARGMTATDWAKQAGVHRYQADRLEKGENITLGSIERLLAPLDLALLVAPRAELTQAREDLQQVQGFLQNLLKAREPITTLLAPLGLSATILTEAEITDMIDRVRRVLELLKQIETRAQTASSSPAE